MLPDLFLDFVFEQPQRKSPEVELLRSSFLASCISMPRAALRLHGVITCITPSGVTEWRY